MKKLAFFAIAAAMAFVACNKDPEVIKPDDSKDPEEQTDPTPDNPGGQTSDDLMATLCINEVCGVVGYKSIELYNPTSAAIDLEGVSVFKNEAETATWTGEAGNSIPSKGFWVITSKKEFDEITDVANAKALDSFSPSKSLLLVLKDKDGNVLDTFDRGWTKAGNTEIALPTAEGSFARTEDAKKEWKELSITIGATNKGATVIGDIKDVAE
ncbi:MAG: lamin tail domain-containing protein [Bacteroidales bacterium]|nr:lamin tail domain-containing protein [Bacteroidales bacterium]